MLLSKKGTHFSQVDLFINMLFYSNNISTTMEAANGKRKGTQYPWYASCCHGGNLVCSSSPPLTITLSSSLSWYRKAVAERKYKTEEGEIIHLNGDEMCSFIKQGKMHSNEATKLPLQFPRYFFFFSSC